MQETYTRIGSYPGSVSPWVMFAFLSLIVIARSIKKKAISRPGVGLLVLGAILIFAKLPLEISFGVCYLALGIYCAVALREKPKIGQILTACSCVAMAAIFGIYIPVTKAETITLNESGAVSRDHQAKQYVPRRGLAMKVEWVDDVFSNEPLGYFTTVNGKNPGPSVSGSQLYWGSHGIVNGNVVGQRIAQWAGITPLSSNKTTRASNL